jgi:hypothetical protein
MTIDQAKERFADLLVAIEKSMDAQIDEVRIKRNTTASTFNGKAYERSEVKVTIIFD